MSRPVRFVTGNEGKVREAREYLPVPVERVECDYPEIQADSLEPIATAGAREVVAALELSEPVMVEDSGLFIREVGGFPGPYSAYVEQTIGVEGLFRLADRECDPPRRATFESVIAWADPDGSTGGADGAGSCRVETFVGSVTGRIVSPRGEGGFGYDPIFEYNGQTLAEMSTAEKNAISHRGRALAALGDWLAGSDSPR